MTQRTALLWTIVSTLVFVIALALALVVAAEAKTISLDDFDWSKPAATTGSAGCGAYCQWQRAHPKRKRRAVGHRYTPAQHDSYEDLEAETYQLRREVDDLETQIQMGDE